MINKTLLLVLFAILSNSCFSQLLRFRSTHFSRKYLDETKNLWTRWSDPKETRVLITIDFDNDRIKIYSKVPQVYDIITSDALETDTDGDEILSWECLNEEGEECMVRFVILHSKNKKTQLYVDLPDKKWMYNIFKLE